MNLLNHEDLYLVHSPELFQESYQGEAVYLTEEEEYALDVFDALNEDFEISTLSDYLAENFEEAELDLIWEAVDYLQSLFYENFDFDSIQEINESILTLDPESIEELLEDWVYEEGTSEYTLEDIHESVQSVYGSYDLLQEGIFGFSRKKKAIPTDQYTDSELNRKIEESLSTLKVASLIAEAGVLGKVAKGLKTAKNVADTYSSNRKYVMGKVSNPLLQTAGVAASDILTTKHFIDKLRGKGKDKQGSNTYSAPNQKSPYGKASSYLPKGILRTGEREGSDNVKYQGSSDFGKYQGKRGLVHPREGGLPIVISKSTGAPLYGGAAKFKSMFPGTEWKVKTKK